MKRMRVDVDRQGPFFIDLAPNQLVTLSVTHSAAMHAKEGEATVHFSMHGMRWEGEEAYALTWHPKVLLPNASLTIKFIDDDAVEAHALVPDEQELVVHPRTCRFCDRDIAEVRHLVERGFFARICDECAEECVRLMRELDE